jgi:hypothetical protein
MYQQIKKGQRNADVRLADFKVKSGDSLILREWDNKTRKYTSRKLVRKVKAVQKIPILDFYRSAKLKKHGLYLIEFE